AAGLGRCGDVEVYRDGRPADAALGAEDSDDDPGFARFGRPRATRGGTAGGDRRGRDAALLVPLTRAHLADRRGQLVTAERLDEEFASSGEHRAAEVVRLALH